MTKKENFVAIAEIVKTANADNRTELLEFIEHEIKLIEKKASYKSETKTQKANKELVETMYNVLAEIDHPVTCSDFRNTCFPNLSIPKVSAMLTKLVNSDRVTRTYEKKVSYFTVK